MSKFVEKLIKTGAFEPVNLEAGNVQPGDSILNRNGLFGTLIKITKKGNYKVRFDSDFLDEKPTKFAAVHFESLFLVDKRKS